MAYKFTNSWFNQTARDYWDEMIPELAPRKILEVGSYEGASTCYLIDSLAYFQEIEIHCVDTWEGGEENIAAGEDMEAVLGRFKHNTTYARTGAKFNVHLNDFKGKSEHYLSELLAGEFDDYFDFIYIDGSHQAPDVLLDAVLAFKLLRPGGIMAFDDYIWGYGARDLLLCPKPAIDAFVNINFNNLEVIPAPLCQLYIRKKA